MPRLMRLLPGEPVAAAPVPSARCMDDRLRPKYGLSAALLVERDGVVILDRGYGLADGVRAPGWTHPPTPRRLRARDR